MPRYFRSDQARIQVAWPSNPEIPADNTSWDMMEGGDITAETINYLPGGMQPAIELGGVPKRGDLTVARIWSDLLIGAFKSMDNACGSATVKVTYTVLVAANSAQPQSTTTYSGILKSVVRPNYDSNTSGEARLQIVVGLHRSIT